MLAHELPHKTSQVETDWLTFTGPFTPPEAEGVVNWNFTDHTLDLQTGLGPVLQVGQEELTHVYNDTGDTLYNGKVVTPTGGIYADGTPHVDYAIASLNGFASVESLVVLTHDVANGEKGLATLRGKVRGANTLGLTPGIAYLSPTVAGDLTDVKPAFPDYPIRVGGVLNASETNGTILVSIRGRRDDTFQNFHNGTIRESFDFRTSVVGGVVVGSLEPTNGHDDLTLIFSDGFHILDTAPAATIELTAGTDIAPVTNLVYILKSDPTTMVVSTTGWPITVEHVKVAAVVLQSVSTTDTEGALRNQNINDHVQCTDTNQGHLSHIGVRIRVMGAEWHSGTEAVLSNPANTELYFAVSEGQVYQMHEQTYPAQDMSGSDNCIVVNDPDTAYRITDNLADMTKDATGVAMQTGRYYPLVLWGVCNKTGEASHMMVNLPIGQYTSESAAMNDALGYSVYSIPKIFKGVGFLIGRYVVKKEATGFSYSATGAYQDLRGYSPNSTAGSGAGSSGITTFLGLTDTPIAHAAQYQILQSTGSALEYTDDPTFANLTVTSQIDCAYLIASVGLEADYLTVDNDADISGELTVDGHLAFGGGATSFNTGLSASFSFANELSTYYGYSMFLTANWDGTIDTVQYIDALALNTRVNAVGTGQLGIARGLNALVSTKWSGGLVDDVEVVKATFNSGSGHDEDIGNVWLFKGTKADDISGVITNMFGLELPDITWATNNYAIKTGSGLVSFGDDMDMNGNDIDDVFELELTAPGTGRSLVLKMHDNSFTYGGSLTFTAGTTGTANHLIHFKTNLTFDQSVGISNSPTFAGLTVSGAAGITVSAIDAEGLKGGDGYDAVASSGTSNFLTGGDGGDGYGGASTAGDGGDVTIEPGAAGGQYGGAAGSSGNVILKNIPTSASGLPTGAVWSNSGVLTIV